MAYFAGDPPKRGTVYRGSNRIEKQKNKTTSIRTNKELWSPSGSSAQPDKLLRQQHIGWPNEDRPFIKAFIGRIKCNPF